MPTVPNSAWDAWVAGYRSRALNAGVSASTFDAAFARAGYTPGVIERDRSQTEFTRTLEDYLAIAASDARIATGRAELARRSALMAEIEARFGVERQVFTAIWGLESQYGTRMGNIPVVSSTSTLAFDGRRGRFFEQQLTAALKILQNGDTTPDRMVGSWAGAMGHTQFIPTSYELYAVDFRGDGRRDIWSADPTDGLASAAAYLANSGWQRGLPWGAEAGTAAARGLSGRTIQPQAGGPSFVVTSNFNVIKRYNNSDLYAIGVGHLSDRLRGGGPIQASFPPDANGLTKDMRIELQQRLTRAGFDTQGADGVIGSNTREAISAYQARNGLPVTGEPSVDLLNRLR
ncbi:Membrane-bound lytic murein transglycosylase B precursor [Flavimaricola marinus]|uniref:Membrane-bound lytic murein transglycosylase B n=2 Tax=Flavimaricola marinus TaxID=1819565 RepID=A0A238LER2_9RHOB|nr:Membrane-bound lytic murein transglycosylase B precursor [Flavimaricola marinus]